MFCAKFPALYWRKFEWMRTPEDADYVFRELVRVRSDPLYAEMVDAYLKTVARLGIDARAYAQVLRPVQVVTNLPVRVERTEGSRHGVRSSDAGVGVSKLASAFGG